MLTKPWARVCVDVTGQALALGQSAALALGRGQLAAGRLQLLDQLPALVALLDDPGDPEANRLPNTTESSRHDRPGFSHSGRPELSTSRQTTAC